MILIFRAYCITTSCVRVVILCTDVLCPFQVMKMMRTMTKMTLCAPYAGMKLQMNPMRLSSVISVDKVQFIVSDFHSPNSHFEFDARNDLEKGGRSRIKTL